MTLLFSQQEKQINLPVSDDLIHALHGLVDKSSQDIYVVGGTIRDHLLGRDSLDVDLTVSGSAIECGKMLLAELKGGTLVDLSTPQDDAVRVVYRGEQIDISSFRRGAETIEQDLSLRDFSINAISAPLKGILGKEEVPLIDPVGGVKDLKAGRVVHLPGAFVADPVRMVRAYRFCAVLGFSLDAQTKLKISECAPRIGDVAVERVTFELAKIFESSRAGTILKAMDETGLLALIFPELYLGRGVDQPDFHHLDVFDHCFQALAEIEAIIDQPELYFTEHLELVKEYLEDKNHRSALKWAALFHDLGKPGTRGFSETDSKRVTFHGHDEVGKKISQQIAHRLKWSSADTERVGDLIGMHMHPFHLCNVQRDEKLTRRAVLKLCRRAGDELVGLFLLAMSDSLASEGKLKPPHMEAEILLLFQRVVEMYEQLIKPVLTGPRLITGSDLIQHFQLTPGPLFGEIMGELEIARVEGKVDDRQAALTWVADYLTRRKKEVEL